MGCLRCEMFGVFDVWDFGMWNVQTEVYLRCGMFEKWGIKVQDVQDLGCFICEMFRNVRDIGC